MLLYPETWNDDDDDSYVAVLGKIVNNDKSWIYLEFENTPNIGTK